MQRDACVANPNGAARLARHVGRQSQWRSVLHAPQRRPCSQSPPAFRATPPRAAPAASACRCVLRNARSTLTSTNQRIPCACHDFAPPHTSTRARPISRTGPQNPAVSAAAHGSLRRPRKTMPGDSAGHAIPHACHTKRTLRARIPMPVTRNHAHGASRWPPFPTPAMRNARSATSN